MTTITSFNDVLAKMTPETKPQQAPLFRALTKVLEVRHPSGKANFTSREWFEMHTGKRVDTAQLQHVGGFWGPLARLVNTDRKTYVLLEGSRRDYSDMKAIYADRDTLWVSLHSGREVIGAAVYTLTD